MGYVQFPGVLSDLSTFQSFFADKIVEPMNEVYRLLQVGAVLSGQFFPSVNVFKQNTEI